MFSANMGGNYPHCFTPNKPFCYTYCEAFHGAAVIPDDTGKVDANRIG